MHSSTCQSDTYTEQVQQLDVLILILWCIVNEALMKWSFKLINCFIGHVVFLSYLFVLAGCYFDTPYLLHQSIYGVTCLLINLKVCHNVNKTLVSRYLLLKVKTHTMTQRCLCKNAYPTAMSNNWN